ncbi:MAG: RsmE family RNA methyltransferase [Verrucomicrobiota bacterium JB022]|nr:RsmE family RNA methyltransferase [Verrucomicrobiota bacterium JB022]
MEDWPDLRVYQPELPAEGGPQRFALSAEESHHLVKVRRAREGEPVLLLDGSGHRWLGTLTVAHAKQAEVEARAIASLPVPPTRVIVGQALPKGKTMDNVVHRAAELGVAVLVPLATHHSEVSLDAKRADSKVEKWTAVAIEALKQCANPHLPEIPPVQSLEAFLQAQAGAEVKLVAALTPETRPLLELMQALSPRPGSIALLVGPEGDFSDREYQQIFAHGYQPVSLGPRILRVETAFVSAVSVIQAALGQ